MSSVASSIPLRRHLRALARSAFRSNFLYFVPAGERLDGGLERVEIGSTDGRSVQSSEAEGPGDCKWDTRITVLSLCDSQSLYAANHTRSLSTPSSQDVCTLVERSASAYRSIKTRIIDKPVYRQIPLPIVPSDPTHRFNSTYLPYFRHE